MPVHSELESTVIVRRKMMVVREENEMAPLLGGTSKEEGETFERRVDQDEHIFVYYCCHYLVCIESGLTSES